MAWLSQGQRRKGFSCLAFHSYLAKVWDFWLAWSPGTRLRGSGYWKEGKSPVGVRKRSTIAARRRQRVLEVRVFPFYASGRTQSGCYDIEGDACCKDVLEDAKPSIKRCETVLLMLQIVDHLLDETDRTQVRNRYFCFGVDHTSTTDSAMLEKFRICLLIV